MLALTSDMFLHIAPQGNHSICAGAAADMPAAMEKYAINTLNRAAHFLGQCAEETAGFKTLTEYASGREYEGRRDLGNIHAGDGVKYKGRGFIQLTGEYNAKVYGEALGVDFINHPELEQDPKYAALTAALFWHKHNLNALSDANNISAITRSINGGLNGLADREIYVARAKKVLAPLFA